MVSKKRYVFGWAKVFLFSLVIFIFGGCASKTPPLSNGASLSVPSSPPPPPPKSPAEVSELQPIFEEISPLETRKLSLSVKEEDVMGIFYLLAREVGLNLVVEREVLEYLSPERRLVTAEFHDYTVKEILETLCRILDLVYEIHGGVIHIKAFEERLFDLSFLQTLRSSKFSLGGDVLGGTGGMGGTGGGGGATGGNEYVSPLRGQYEVSGETTKESTDIYKQLEDSIKTLLSKDGTFTFNRLTGNLFVRDHPSRIRRVAELVERLRSKYARQVLIEAKIVEVELSQGHDLGIDWVRIQETRLPNASSVSLDLRPNMATLTFSYQHKPSFEGMLKLLETYGEVRVLSNPRIRILHGQPALISVGRSVGYVREVTREVVSMDNVSQTQTTVDTSAIFDGLLLGVTPHIADSGEIILHIVPIKSDLVELRKEEFGTDTTVTLPQVNLREMSTVIKVTSHDLVAIGGLILDKRNIENRKVWGLSRIPGLGALFTHSVKDTRKVELVILLRVSLV